jgi:hypothetical protein
LVSGTLNVPGGFTNQNLIAIGKAGRLNVQGAFTQNAVATIRLDIAGTAAGTFGRVTATGAATINGTLDLRLVDGFVPNVSDVFTVFTYASRTGTFVTITDNDVAHRLQSDLQRNESDADRGVIWLRNYARDSER